MRSVALLLCAGCVGSVSTGGGGTPGKDGSVDGTTIKRDALVWVDSQNGSGNGLPCLNGTTPPGDGHHNPGMDCMQGCHNHGFTACGTLYQNATGNIPWQGAHVTITDANNQVIDMVTMQNGNFYTSSALAFPVQVIASDCPSAVKMNAGAANGHCNANGCHPGGTAMQMHLP